MSPVRVLLVDQSPTVRAALRDVLAAEPDIDVVADTGDSGEAIRLATRHRPAVVVFDAQLEGQPLRALRLFHHHQPRIGIVAFSGFELQLSAEQFKNAGIAELLIKGVHIRFVLDAVRRVARADRP
ncbi:response regulator transcription factor [Amycolatopsis sp. NPDC049691]|uniref:response regulator n=1 Tax=Amycolatopsis sp. NPDC049691 TaxID=3155155 RepID=UPI00344771EB